MYYMRVPEILISRSRDSWVRIFINQAPTYEYLLILLGCIFTHLKDENHLIFKIF